MSNGHGYGDDDLGYYGTDMVDNIGDGDSDDSSNMNTNREIELLASKSMCLDKT